MILICDNTKRKMRDEVRDTIISKGIPCAVCHTDDIDKHLPAAIAVATERYIVPDVSYMVDMRSPKTPVFTFGEDRPLENFVLEVYERILKERANGTGYSHIRVTDKGIMFCNCFIKPTKTELRIIRLLLSLPYWHTAEKITLYCMKDRSSDFSRVAVHISNLNRKAKAATGRCIIDCKRYLGYRITEFCLE